MSKKYTGKKHLIVLPSGIVVEAQASASPLTLLPSGLPNLYKGLTMNASLLEIRTRRLYLESLNPIHRMLAKMFASKLDKAIDAFVTKMRCDFA